MPATIEGSELLPPLSGVVVELGEEVEVASPPCVAVGVEVEGSGSGSGPASVQ